MKNLLRTLLSRECYADEQSPDVLSITSGPLRGTTPLPILPPPCDDIPNDTENKHNLVLISKVFESKRGHLFYPY